LQNVGNRQARRAIGVVCILSGLSGCLNLGIGLSPTLGSMHQSVVSEGSALPEFARASGGTGSVRVSGQIVGRLRCDYLSPDLREVDGGLKLVVTIVSGRNGCNSLTPSTLSYVASIYNVDPGSWSILVEHRYEGVGGIPGRRLHEVVTVG